PQNEPAHRRRGAPPPPPRTRSPTRREECEEREEGRLVKRTAAILALVFGVPMLQGSLAPFLPAAFRPDLALLVVFALSLSWRDPATGLVLAAVCGFVVDLFSGAVLG